MFAEVIAIIAGNGLIQLLTIRRDGELICPAESIQGVGRSKAIRQTL